MLLRGEFAGTTDMSLPTHSARESRVKVSRRYAGRFCPVRTALRGRPGVSVSANVSRSRSRLGLTHDHQKEVPGATSLASGSARVSSAT